MLLHRRLALRAFGRRRSHVGLSRSSGATRGETAELRVPARIHDVPLATFIAEGVSDREAIGGHEQLTIGGHVNGSYYPAAPGAPPACGCCPPGGWPCGACCCAGWPGPASVSSIRFNS